MTDEIQHQNVVQVGYTVSLSAFVNLDTKEVVRVQIYTDGIELADGEFYGEDGGPVNAEDRAAALEIAENETWPSW